MHRTLGSSFLSVSLVSLVTLVPALALGQEPAPAPAPAPPQVVLVLEAVDAPCPTTPVSTQPPVVIEEAHESPPATPSPGPFQLGVSGLLGLRDTGHDVAATWTAGLDVGVRLTPREERWLLVDLSLRRITVGLAETLAGERIAIGASPAVAVGGRPLDFLELYAQAGVALQSRFGGTQGNAVGVAPFVGGGVRFYPVSFFSIAIEGALHVPATRGVLFGNEVFPQASALFQGGLALTFHIG